MPGPNHVHINVLDALEVGMRDRLEPMVPADDWTHADKLAAYKAIYQVMGQAFAQNKLFKPGSDSLCLAHDGRCPAFDPLCGAGQASGRPMSVVVSGAACTARSASGKQEGSAHSTTLPWFAFVFYVLHFKLDMVIHEITELRPDEIIKFHFGGEYDITSLHVSPWQLGFPVRRLRRYRILTTGRLRP